jgi:hypothetical protein
VLFADGHPIIIDNSCPSVPSGNILEAHVVPLNLECGLPYRWPFHVTIIFTIIIIMLNVGVVCGGGGVGVIKKKCFF